MWLILPVRLKCTSNRFITLWPETASLKNTNGNVQTSTKETEILTCILPTEVRIKFHRWWKSTFMEQNDRIYMCPSQDRITKRIWDSQPCVFFIRQMQGNTCRTKLVSGKRCLRVVQNILSPQAKSRRQCPWPDVLLMARYEQSWNNALFTLLILPSKKALRLPVRRCSNFLPSQWFFFANAFFYSSAIILIPQPGSKIENKLNWDGNSAEEHW